MIVLFTDFGLAGPYVGLMKLVLYTEAPGVPVVDLFADAPVHNILSNSYLLAAYIVSFPVGTIFLAVVDPGVGTDTRRPLVVNCDGRWLVGPGNGLFDIVIKRAKTSKQWDIHWRPESLSSSFHGRDLFAPVAAMLAMGQRPDLQPLALDEDRLAQLPDDLAEVIYIDHFGNLISGIRSASVTEGGCLFYQGTVIPRVKTFADVATGRPLCYENSNGLLEISVNQGRAERYFESQIGDRLEIVSPII